jgi:hypothetical protein
LILDLRFWIAESLDYSVGSRQNIGRNLSYFGFRYFDIAPLDRLGA